MGFVCVVVATAASDVFIFFLTLSSVLAFVCGVQSEQVISVLD